MPNVGRPSRDCHTCRKRRTKCDLERPGCGQCRRKGSSCPGYRDEATARFRIQNVSSFTGALGKDRRKRQGRGESNIFTKGRNQITVTNDCVDYRNQAKTSRNSVQHSSAFLCSLTESWDIHILPFFMECVQSAQDLSRDIYGIMPRVIAQAKSSSALYHACNAVASIFLARKVQFPNTVSNHVRAYDTAISTLRTALQDPQEVKSDDTLLAIWLLSMYEFLHDERNVTHSWLFHSGIIAHLIRVRGPEQFSRQDGRDLFLVLLSNTEMQTYMLGKEWKEATTWFQHFYRYCDAWEYLRLRTCVFCHQCSQLCGKIQCLLNANQPDEILANASSIQQDAEAVGNDTFPLVDLEPIAYRSIYSPLVPDACPDQFDGQYCGGALIMQTNFRMRLAYHLLAFFQRASNLSICTADQRETYKGLQNHYIREIHTLPNRVLHLYPEKSSQLFVAGQTIKSGAKEESLSPTVNTNRDHFTQDPVTERAKQTDLDLSRMIKVDIDFERVADGKSTLVLDYRESAIIVTQLAFDSL
ncbi:hypothetical protein BGW36DRAFT_372407 [Talaromyces proteolyticus]|uniref:Zn(2)-C6 fungal-type domain-containing protein n=1 Tax=Talaromyces proteolyticus TaxID=1131652 RepID=A0AAD4Q411_9EURO|nr:uncharacterized protein BGW36DRAFT_372407 [Talaromyces proteolyticus]KAH8702217.1 hypothetical protein BGW36DRAFT_372407 [Talaromyces proteolyticus]